MDVRRLAFGFSVNVSAGFLWPGWPPALRSLVRAGMGCDIVRVGFEENIYLPDRQPAERNHQLVDAMTNISQVAAREVATVADARQVLAIGK